MRKPKFEQIIDISLEKGPTANIIAGALYVSAKGTKHFYDALRLLVEQLPEIYLTVFT